MKETESNQERKFLKVHLFNAPCCCGKAPTTTRCSIWRLLAVWSFREQAWALSLASAIFHEPSSWSEAQGSRREMECRKMQR